MTPGVSWGVVLAVAQHHLYGIPTKTTQAELNHEETSDNPQLRNTLRNTLFRTSKVVKDKNRRSVSNERTQEA